MDATDRLCRMLDEMGVEHEDADISVGEKAYGATTYWECGDVVARFSEKADAGTLLEAWDASPEQAIAATVGPTLDQDLQQALDFMRIWITDDAHLGESYISYELEKAEGLRKLEAIEQAIAATLGEEHEMHICKRCGVAYELNIIDKGFGKPRFCPNCGYRRSIND